MIEKIKNFKDIILNEIKLSNNLVLQKSITDFTY